MLIIDRSKATLPDDHSLYRVIFTYGREVKTLVSATDEKQAKNIVKSVYDYLNPKIIKVEFLNNNHEIIHDRTKEAILGKLNIINNEEDCENEHF